MQSTICCAYLDSSGFFFVFISYMTTNLSGAILKAEKYVCAVDDKMEKKKMLLLSANSKKTSKTAAIVRDEAPVGRDINIPDRAASGLLVRCWCHGDAG